MKIASNLLRKFPLPPIIVGISTFCLIVGPSRINPENIGWIANTINPDTWTQFIGWELYRYAPWTFPIGINLGVIGLNSSIVYSGGIALLEIPLKTLNSLLPETFQYLGAWLLICFILQAVTSWYLLNTLTGLTIIERILGVVLFCFSPILIWRLNLHLGLAAHFLIILAIYLCIKGNQNGTFFRSQWSLLVSLTLFIHGYFTVMVSMIFFFHLVRYIFCNFESKRSLHFLQVFGATLPLPVLSFWLLGYLNSSSGWSTGFPNHLFKMDLIQPFNISGYSWALSELLPETVGNPEGFNFLGIWVFAMLFALYLFSRTDFSSARELLAGKTDLNWAIGLLALFSLSNRISIGRKFIEVPLPTQVLDVMEIFRASGRFFWPTVYLVYYYVFLLLSKSRSFQRKKAILAMATLLHCLDSSYYWENLSKINSKPLPAEITYLEEFSWSELRKSHSKIKYDLNVKHSKKELCPYWAEIGFVAAKYKFETNCAYLARYDEDVFRNWQSPFQRDLQSEDFESGTIYVTEVDKYLSTNPDRCVKTFQARDLLFAFKSMNCGES